MPSPSSEDTETPTPEQDMSQASTDPAPKPVDSNAPLSFVPHDASGAIPQEPVRIRTGRYGELEAHEIIHLLDTIEDERARSRFRESIYISCFVWLVLAWVGFYGPRYLWHAPRVVNPMDVLKERQLTQLNMPLFTPRVAAPRPAPKVDNSTLERLREMSRERAAARPAPPLPNAPTPAPSAVPLPPPTAAPNIPLPAAPSRTPPPVLADAPTPQPSTRPNFNTGSETASDAMKNAVNGAARDRNGGSYGRGYDRGPSSPLNMGGAEILSDTMGVNFNPYLQRILSDIKRNWMPLIPEEARPPLSKQGETFIRFTILPDGNIGDASMHLDGSTHDEAINRSCWGAITSEGQFPPLPSQFRGPGLELRIHFLVNKEIQ